MTRNILIVCFVGIVLVACNNAVSSGDSYNNTTQTNIVAPPQMASSTDSGNYYVRVGSFGMQNDASDAAKKMSHLGNAYAVKQKNGRYIIMVGPYRTRGRAASVRHTLMEDYSDTIIVE